MAIECALASGYFAFYLGWTRLVRSYVEPWLRGWFSRHLGVAIVWVPLSTFPFKVWAWGLLASKKMPLDHSLALCSSALCLVGAFVPIASLSVLLWWTGFSSLPTRQALYLLTPFLLLFFAGSLLGRGQG